MDTNLAEETAIGTGCVMVEMTGIEKLNYDK